MSTAHPTLFNSFKSLVHATNAKRKESCLFTFPGAHCVPLIMVPHGQAGVTTVVTSQVVKNWIVMRIVKVETLMTLQTQITTQTRETKSLTQLNQRVIQVQKNHQKKGH